MNVIWENRGIVLGIMSYVLKHFYKLRRKPIIIPDSKIRYLVRNLFRDLDIKSSGEGFKIRIRTNKNKPGLIINNLKNLDKISGEKISVLPWFDVDNPVIMFRYNDSKNQDIKSLSEAVRRFNRVKRFLPHNSINSYQLNCGLNIWDTDVEYRTIFDYSLRYNVDPYNVYKFITNEVGGLDCKNPGYIPFPVPMREEVYVPVETEVPVVKEVVKEVVVEKKVPVVKECGYDKINDFIGIVSDKIELLDKII